MCLHRFVLALALCVCMFADAAERKRPEYDRTFFEPCEKVVTPHIRWAKPYCRGPIRVLYITHRNAMREVVEISQRFSMKYTVFAAEHPDTLGESGKGIDRPWRLIKGNSAEELADRLRRNLRADYDLIVVANFNWNQLPNDCQYEILRKVKSGTGLVGCVPKGREPYLARVISDGREKATPETLKAVVAGIPFGVLPAFAKDTTVEDFCRNRFACGQLGKGRILLFEGIRVPRAFQGLTPAAQGDVFELSMLDYDYYLSLVIKAMLWTARREPPVTVRTDFIVKKVQRSNGSAREIEFTFKANRWISDVSVRWALRRDRNVTHREDEFQMKLGAGITKVGFALPNVPAGRYFLDTWVMRNERILGWGSGAVEVSSPTRIAEVKLGKESFSRKETITGEAVLQGVGDEMKLRLSLFDNLSRLLSVQTLPVKRGQTAAQFELSTAGTRTILQRLLAELIQDEETVDVKQRFVPLRDFYADRQDVRFIMWDGFPENQFLSRYAAREFRRHGIDTQYTHLTRWAFLENLYFLPYAIRFVDKKTDWYQLKRTRAAGDHVRTPCLTDPAYRKEVCDTLTKAVGEAAVFSTNDVSLGDECHFVAGHYELCFSPTCTESFREFLRKEYASLEALNREYGTSYTSWDQIMPLPLDQALETGRFALWVDYRRHMESVWADIFALSRTAIREVVPDARVGYEGSGVWLDSFSATDFDKLMSAMDLNNIYFRRFTVNAVPDLAKPHTLFGAGWYGGYASNRNTYHMRWFPWMALLRGANSFWVWMGHGNPGSVMAPDLSLYPFFETNCREVAEIKRGIGKMLMSSEQENDGILVLYSPPSVHVNTAIPGAPKIQSTLASLCCVLEDIGLQFRVLASERLTPGALTNGNWRLLLMPQVTALSTAQAKEIAAFVRHGGIVLADLLPAITNEHGTLHKQPILNDVFGVWQADAPIQLKPGEVVIDPYVPGIQFTGALGQSPHDAGLKLAGGRAGGSVTGAPALILNTHGKGRAILLNFSLADYYDRRRELDATERYYGWHRGTPLRQFMKQLFESVSILPAVHIEPVQPRCLIAKFRSGDTQYIGILPEMPYRMMAYTLKEAKAPAPARVRIKFPGVGHLYDVRAGTYMGNVDEIRTKLHCGCARLFAVHPYRVEGISLDVDEDVREGGVLRIRGKLITTGKTGLHVVRVTFFGPDGKEVDYYSTNLKADGGTFEGEWKLALNEDLCIWRVEVRDVSTGVTASRKFGIVRE